jgi:hypothetical protein
VFSLGSGGCGLHKTLVSTNTGGVAWRHFSIRDVIGGGAGGESESSTGSLFKVSQKIRADATFDFCNSIGQTRTSNRV